MAVRRLTQISLGRGNMLFTELSLAAVADLAGEGGFSVVRAGYGPGVRPVPVLVNWAHVMMARDWLGDA